MEGRTHQPEEHDRLHDGNLEAAQAFLQGELGRSDDFRLRRFRLGGPDGPRVLMGYLDGMIDEKGIDDRVISPLMKAKQMAKAPVQELAYQADVSLTARSLVRRSRNLGTAVQVVLDAGVVLFFDGCPEILFIAASGYPTRGIDKPETEHAVQGPREGFTESVAINLTQVRRRLKHTDLRVKFIEVGTRSHVRVAVLHIDGLTNPAVVDEVTRRLDNIQIDHLQGPGMVMEYLNDHPWTPFPMLRTTERPDEVARQLVEGKTIILMDGHPFAVAAPSVLMDFYQTMDDYHFGFWGASAVRLVRFFGFIISLFMPAIYIALIAVNPEMVPNELALTIAATREGLPFPPVIEVLIIELLIELIREAALRLPQPLGSTIGVVGGVVVGQAIVQAGIVSPLIIIFAATTMLASFTSPTMDIGFTWRILKWFLVILANGFGVVGIIVGSSCVIAHMAALSSFGVPYLSPFGPLRVRDLGDTIVRLPFIIERKRPSHLRTLDEQRQGSYQHPEQLASLERSQQQRGDSTE